MVTLNHRTSIIGVLLTWWLCLAAGTPAISQTQSWYEQDDVSVVISPSRLRQPITEAPTAITVLDRELIEQSGATSIVDLLLLVPGFQVSRLLHGYPVATYHGQSTRFNPQIQLIIDGRPAYIPLYGGIPWGDLPISLSDVERIEVVRSPNAATFGPNSYFAVISITTTPAASHRGWIVKTEAGGNEFGKATISGSGSKDNIDYRITAEAAHSEGYDNLPDTERDKRATLYSSWQINNSEKLEFDAGFTRSGYIELNNVVTTGDLTPYRDIRNGFTRINWERASSSESSDSLSYHYSRFSMNETGLFLYDLGETLRDPQFSGINLEVPLNRYAVSARHEIEFERTRRLNNNHRINTGAALRYDSVKGAYLFNDTRQHEIYTGRAFFNSEYAPHPKFLLNTGLMFENNTIRDSTLLPRFAAIYRYQPNRSFRLSYSRGERTPLLLETEGNVTTTGNVPALALSLTDTALIGSPGLQPETIDVYELGYTAVLRKTDLTFDAKIARQIVSNKIYNFAAELPSDTFDGAVRQYDNEDFSAKMTNLELQIEFNPNQNIRLRGAYSYSFEFDTALAARMLTPEHTLSLFGSVRNDNGFSMSAEYYHSSDWIWDDVADTSRMNRLDLRLARSFDIGGADFNIFFQTQQFPGKNVDYVERNKIKNTYSAGFSLNW